MAAKKKKTSTKTSKAATVVDPRAAIKPTKAAIERCLADVAAVIRGLTPPPEPQPTDLVGVMLHVVFAAGLPCGYGQEVRRRIAEEYVDLNEYRVTEAYDTEEILADLQLPDTFERCRVAKNAVFDLYNDQNSISLEFLREAGIAERKGFFQRVPAIPTDVGVYLAQVVDFDEVLFSPRSTQRVQARIGLDKFPGRDAFVAQIRELIAPFGHLPIDVGPNRGGGKPILDPELSPLCLVHRLLGKS